MAAAGEASDDGTGADYDRTVGYGERQQARGSADSRRAREEADDVQSDRRPAGDPAGMHLDDDAAEEESGHGAHPAKG